jgi:hypothetical protein
MLRMTGFSSVVVADVHIQVAGSNMDEHVCGHGETRGM